MCFNLGVALRFGLLTEWFAAAVLDESKCRGNHSLKRKSFDQSRSLIAISVGHSVSRWEQKQIKNRKELVKKEKEQSS